MLKHAISGRDQILIPPNMTNLLITNSELKGLETAFNTIGRIKNKVEKRTPSQ